MAGLFIWSGGVFHTVYEDEATPGLRKKVLGVCGEGSINKMSSPVGPIEVVRNRWRTGRRASAFSVRSSFPGPSHISRL